VAVSFLVAGARGHLLGDSAANLHNDDVLASFSRAVHR
jgi:hypothetical protein